MLACAWQYDSQKSLFLGPLLNLQDEGIPPSTTRLTNVQIHGELLLDWAIICVPDLGHAPVYVPCVLPNSLDEIL